MTIELAMEDDYNTNVESFREKEYPMLQDAVYLDHAGATLYSKSLMERFMANMMSNLYGNPHSASPSSQLSTNRIEDIRLRVLQFFKADPEDFNVVFVANATAGIKLVMDAFREQKGGFSYGYHKDAHTSIVGVRENAVASRCLDDEDVERWLSGRENMALEIVPYLFAYPAQSNLDGRRLPLSWAGRARRLQNSGMTYTLLDASALVSTSQLDLSDVKTAPDFTVLSFYKIFGFPDLGTLIVRKASGSILQDRKYFGGGTVDTVLSVKEQWHVLKDHSLHETLEDGTIPFHSIMALDAAIETHRELYGSMNHISKHTSFLAQKLYNGLASLRHANSEPVCIMHSSGFASNHSLDTQGPIVAFNIRNYDGAWVSNTEFERLASIKKFHIRSGGLCNPGGVATALNLEPFEIRRNFSAGFRCGKDNDIFAGKPTGILRASIGAMSTKADIESFVSFVREFYTDIAAPNPIVDSFITSQSPVSLFVENLTVYPIKSCGGFTVPPNTPWEVRPEGLTWDREWCLLHRGTGQALSQKRHPRMALIRPSLDFHQGLLHVSYRGKRPAGLPQNISIPLSANPNLFSSPNDAKFVSSRVCGDTVVAQTYASKEINEFFSAALGVPCVLARFPAGGSGYSTRHSKAHMQKHQRHKNMLNDSSIQSACSSPPTPPDSDNEAQKRPILLSNESPILVINGSSLNALNKIIAQTGGKPATASVFRANIVLASTSPEYEQPYSEDHWTAIRIGQQSFHMLGSCRRCHMICVDQDTAEKSSEPFVTLAKTRRFDSKIFFGSHMCHIPLNTKTKESQCPSIKVGDFVTLDARDDN